MQAYEDGVLDRRVLKQDATGGGVKFPLYYLWSFGDGMTAAVAHQLLDLVLSKEDRQ